MTAREISHAYVEVRPALRLEEAFEHAAVMGRTRRYPGTRLPRLADLALYMLEFRRELAVPDVPALLVKRFWPVRLAGTAAPVAVTRPGPAS